MSTIRKISKAQLASASAQANIRKLNAGISHSKFQTKIARYQIANEKGKSDIQRKVESLDKHYTKAIELHAKLKELDIVPLTNYQNLIDNYESIANKDSILEMIIAKSEQRSRDMERCVSDEQKEVVHEYYSQRFLEPLSRARVVEKFLIELGYEVKTVDYDNVEVLASDLLNEEGLTTRVEPETQEQPANED